MLAGMTRRALLALPLIFASSLAFVRARPATMPATRPVVVAYMPNWVDAVAFTKTWPAERLTHVNIAFENPVDDDGNMSWNPQADDTIVEAAHRANLKVSISIGGGAASGNKQLLARYALLMSPERCKGFAAKLAQLVQDHHLDGLDVDVEGPSITKDYGGFIDALGAEFKPRGLLLSAALSKGYGGDKVPDSVFKHFDLVNVMAYDEKGYWNPNDPGQHSSLPDARESARYFIDRGLPPAKTVLGVPFYGYGFGKDFKKRDYPYNEIVAAHPGAENLDQVGETIFYNGIPTVRAKCEYVRERGLAGVMIWSLDTDAPGDKSLLAAIDRALNPR